MGRCCMSKLVEPEAEMEVGLEVISFGRVVVCFFFLKMTILAIALLCLGLL